jgi:hypothetical protein
MKLIYSLLLLSGIASAQVEAGDQPFNLPRILGKWVPVDMSGEMLENKEPRTHNIKWIHFLPNNKVEWSVKIGPTSKPKIRHGSYTLSHSGNLVHHSTKRVLLRIDPVPYNPAVGGVREDGTPIFLMDVRAGKGIDNRFDDRMELLTFSTQHTRLAFTKSSSEQGGADTPVIVSITQAAFRLVNNQSEYPTMDLNIDILAVDSFRYSSYCNAHKGKLNVFVSFNNGEFLLLQPQTSFSRPEDEADVVELVKGEKRTMRVGTWLYNLEYQTRNKPTLEKEVDKLRFAHEKVESVQVLVEFIINGKELRITSAPLEINE